MDTRGLLIANQPNCPGIFTSASVQSSVRILTHYRKAGHRLSVSCFGILCSCSLTLQRRPVGRKKRWTKRLGMVPLARPAESRCLRKVRKEADRADIVHSLRLPNIFPTFCHSLRSARLTQSGVVLFYPISSLGKTHRVTSQLVLRCFFIKDSFPSVCSFEHRSLTKQVNQRVVFDNTFHYERRSCTQNQF